MPASRHNLAPLCVLICVAACNRYEYRTITCGPDVPPAAASRIGWEATPERVGSVAVRIVGASSSDPLEPGISSARLGEQEWRASAGDGVVRFDSVAIGLHTLEVRALGYHIARTAILVQSDSGVSAVAVMARDRTVPNEACGFMKTRVRKPWWKV